MVSLLMITFSIQHSTDTKMIFAEWKNEWVQFMQLQRKSFPAESTIQCINTKPSQPSCMKSPNLGCIFMAGQAPFHKGKLFHCYPAYDEKKKIPFANIYLQACKGPCHAIIASLPHGRGAIGCYGPRDRARTRMRQEGMNPRYNI